MNALDAIERLREAVAYQCDEMESLSVTLSTNDARAILAAFAAAIFHLHEGLDADLPATDIGWAARKRFEMALSALGVAA